MTNESRMLIVGWDGGTWRVFRPLAEKGLMPNLKALMDRGCHGVMNSTIPPITPPAWTTLLTGTRPERHGIFGFMAGVLPGEAGDGTAVRTHNSLSIKGATVLDLLGEAGRRVMAVNVPMSYPPHPVNGIMITGMLTPSDAEDYTYPPGLKDEIDDYLIDVAWDTDTIRRATRVSRLSNAALVERCIEIVRTRCDHVLRLSGTHPWDLGIVIFTSTDRLFHRMWGEFESLGRAGKPESRLQELLVAFAAELDRALGRLVEANGDATVMLVSDHGFGPAPHTTVHVDLALQQAGLQVMRTTGGSTAGRALRRGTRRVIRRLMEILLPRKVRRALLKKSKRRLERQQEAMDLSRSKARFTFVDHFVTGAVRFVKETTAPLSEQEKRELAEGIIKVMLDLRDPKTGSPVFVRGRRREELYPNAEVNYLPEVILEFADGYGGRVEPLATELFGGPAEGDQDGHHRIEGMFVLAGPHVRAGGEVDALHLSDIAPLALYLNDLPVPPEMQGEVPTALFTEEHVKDHPVRKTDAAAQPTVSPTSETAYSAEQEEKVKQRLRDLGYLD